MLVCLASMNEAYALSGQLDHYWHRAAASYGELRRKSFLAGRALLQLLLRLDDPFCSLPFISSDIHGKPVFKDFPNLHFNISHSGGLIAISLGSFENGIDIERLRVRLHMDALIQRVLSQEERNYLLAQNISNEEFIQKFYMLWTLRECLLKTSGRGLGGLDDIKINLEQACVNCPRVSRGQTWSIRTNKLSNLLVLPDINNCYMSIYIPEKENVNFCVLNKSALIKPIELEPEFVFSVHA